MDEQIREYLKRQVTLTTGASQEQRERWFIIESLHNLHEKVDRLILEDIKNV